MMRRHLGWNVLYLYRSSEAWLPAATHSEIIVPRAYMAKTLHLLIIEDSDDDVLLLVRELRRGGYEPVFTHIQSREEMKDALCREAWDIIISDYVMPQFSGLDALHLLQESGLDIPFIIVSGNIGEDIAVNAMKAGANDYLIKGNLARLVPAVEREMRDAGVRHARKHLEEARALLAAAIESSVDAVVITNERGTIQFVNPAFRPAIGNCPRAEPHDSPSIARR